MTLQLCDYSASRMKILLRSNPLIGGGEEGNSEIVYNFLQNSNMSILDDSPIFDIPLNATNSNMKGSNDEEREMYNFIRQSRQDGMNIIITYIFLYFIGSFGNLFVLYNLFRTRNRSKMNFYIRQLVIADLVVINFTILIEIFWRITVRWQAGELGCKIFQFMRIFGLYVTSMIIICITLDRFFAFVHPLSVLKSNERNKYLLISAYIISIIASLPNVSTCIFVILFN